MCGFQDLQFSFTLLDQANQAGANVRVTPYALRVGANGQIFQSVKVRCIMVLASATRSRAR